MILDFKNEPSLIQAVFIGNIDEIQTLINKRIDVNLQSPNGRITALHVAAHCSGYQSRNENENENKDANKYSEIIRLLCKSGARINSKDSKSLTPLHYACRTNAHEAVEILLEYQADVNSRGKNWEAPLHICAMYNSVECAKLLLKHMNNIDVSDRLGRSALAHASFNGNYEMVKYLLETGANSNVHDKQERRPLHWASYVGYNNIIRLLVEHGADVNCLDKEFYTPLLVACSSGKSAETIQLLIDLGADTNASTAHDSSIFHLACLNGHDQIVRELLNTHNLTMKVNSKGYHPLHYAAGCKRGAFCLELLVSLNVDVNISSYLNGRTPMHIAALHGRTSCAQILYSNGALINVKDSDDNTPLHLAALNGQISMISFLVQCGANIYIRGSNGMLAWAMAAFNGHSECFKFLDQIIPTISSRKQFFETRDDLGRTFMHLAAISGNYECLYTFINSDCDLNSKDKSGNTPLHYACAGSYLKCVELLVRSGAEINEINTSIFDSDMDTNVNNSYMIGRGCTPLMLACAFDQDGYVVRELILNARANADIVDANGFNTLHYAALQGNRNVFEILLNQCQHLDHQSNEQLISPLHILAYYGHRESLEFLLRNKFDPEVKDKSGRTPLDLACFQGESTCVECLLYYGANYETHDNINERTPIHAAAYNNNEECLKIIGQVANSERRKAKLYENEEDDDEDDDDDCDEKENCYNYTLANLTDKQNRTPLMLAVEQGHFNTITFLINNMGANLLAMDEKKRTALHRAAAFGYEECCVALLKSNKASAYQRDDFGLLPIHYAVIAGHANLINLFFEYDDDSEMNSTEDVTEKSMYNQTFTKQNEEKEIDKLVDRSGFSLMHFACFNGHSTCVETLCDLSDERPYLTEMLIKPKSKSSSSYNRFSPLHFACQNSHDSCVNYLIERFPNNLNIILEIEDALGNRPLHICALNNEYDCASLLLEANCNINPKNKLGQTPFMLAAANNSFAVMELLLSDDQKTPPPKNTTVNLSNTVTHKIKVDLNCLDKNGNSALHLALINKHENSALFILDRLEPNSYLINLKNKEGQTALHLAASDGFITCVEILLSKGADIWIKNSKSKTPLLVCAKDDQVADCLELMLSRLLLMATSPGASAAVATNTTSNIMMMMMNAQNNSNSKTPVNRPTKLNNDDAAFVTLSDVFLNDENGIESVDINTPRTLTKRSSTSVTINSTVNTPCSMVTQVGSSNRKNDMMKYRLKNETNNLNSTLILNEENERMNTTNDSCAGDVCYTTSSIDNLNLNDTDNIILMSNGINKNQFSNDDLISSSLNSEINNRSNKIQHLNSSIGSSSSFTNALNHNGDKNDRVNDFRSSSSSFDCEYY